jgi:hypothetical protein
MAFVGAFLLAIVWSRTARAYPWMNRHDYGACATCHTDPSGGGLLTRYGRAQAAMVLSSPLAAPKDDEPGKYNDFLFGVPLPEQLDLQGWLRDAYLINVSDGKIVDKRLLVMRADLGAHLRAGAFRASGMLGGVLAQGRGYSQEAWVTKNPDAPNLVSREHWVGFAAANEAIVVRAGRLNLPFGLRNVEHTSWVRQETRTDTNQHQQHGVAVAYTGERLRGELMAVLGNFQLGPDIYRERGYSAFAEYAIAPTYAVGVSSLLTHAGADPGTRVAAFRQAHGLFARLAPSKFFAFLAEGDLLVRSLRYEDAQLGMTGLVQADIEPLRGLHFALTGEMLDAPGPSKAMPGAWLTIWWFAFAHMDARIDLIHRVPDGTPATTSLLFQLHGYL